MPEQLPATIDPARVEQVRQLIVRGATEYEIRQLIAKYWPGEAAQPLIASAAKQISEAGDFDAQTVLGWCFEGYREQYRKATEANDISAALRALQSIERLAAQHDTRSLKA